MKTKTLTLLAIALCVYLPAYAGTKKKPQAPKPKPQTESCGLCKVLARHGNNPEGIPALHEAILQNDVRAVNLLLKNGASPHTIDKDNNNCLYWAIKAGSLLMVKQFVSLGVNTGFLSPSGTNALWFAVKENQLEIINFLSNSPNVSVENKSHALRSIALDSGDFCLTFTQRKKISDLLVRNGADINEKLPTGETPLDYALNGSKEAATIEFLKSLGAK